VVAAARSDTANEVLDLLADHRFAVAISVDPFDPSSWNRFAGFVEKAAARDVPVVVGPVVKNARGEPDFFCAETAEAGCEALRKAALMALEESLPVSWFYLDAEPCRSWMRSFLQKTAAGGINAAISWVASVADLTALERARQMLRGTLVQLGELGFYVGVTTVPFLLDDREAGDNVFEAAMGLPISGVPWHTVSFQIYRSLYNGADARGLFGLPSGSFTPYLVHSYAKTAADRYGDKAAVGLGVAGSPAPVEGMGSGFYEDPAELAADISAAKAAGIKRLNQLHLFWLDGMVGSGSVEAWLETVKSPPRDYESEPPTQALRRLLDGVASFLRSRIYGKESR
jgi:hypothetical protein